MRIKLHSALRPIERNHPLCLITGDGRSLPEDKGAFLSWGAPHDTICIGRSIKLFPEALHWMNADGETAIAWARQLKQQRPGLITHTLGPVEGFDVDWDIEQPDYHYEEITHERGRLHGSSAFFAALAAVAMGYERVVLAGCPLDAEGHWYFENLYGPLWLGLDFMAWLDFSRTEDARRVRSMSGYTRQILGGPENV